MLIGSRRFLQKIKNKEFTSNFVSNKISYAEALKNAGFVERQFMDFALR